MIHGAKTFLNSTEKQAYSRRHFRKKSMVQSLNKGIGTYILHVCILFLTIQEMIKKISSKRDGNFKHNCASLTRVVI